MLREGVDSFVERGIDGMALGAPITRVLMGCVERAHNG